MYLHILNNFRKTALLAWCTVIPFLSVAKEDKASIRGTISCDQSNEVIPGANVIIKGSDIGDATDGEGEFFIQNVQPGSYTLVVSCLGYETIEEWIEIRSDGQYHLDIALPVSSITLDGIVIRRVSLTGGDHHLTDIPGSAHYINPKTLDKFNYRDINRILSMIPGVNLQEEDGFGLHPNIGFRGSGNERSSRITLMEDGILIAPAPYAAPAAYYFPNSGRMKGIEIRKGSSQIKYGPYTTGGALNMISTPVPKDLSIDTRLSAGNFGYKDIYAQVGETFGKFGVMAEAQNTSSTGFKQLDVGGNTGFILNDYNLKLKYETSPEARVQQGLMARIGYSSEESNETYLGLTQADFSTDPYRRYSGSQKDHMSSEHWLYSLRHVIQPAKFMDITTTIYRTDFTRNWYKLSDIKAGIDGNKVGIGAILNDPDMYKEEYDIVTGNSSANDDALFVKANNRKYYTQGMESILGFDFNHGAFKSDLEVGLRYHQDQMDRYQWVDEYRMLDSIMMLTKKGLPGTESNRIEDARAFAAFIQYRFSYNKLSVIPGLRHENINQQRDDYGKSDPDRIGVNLKQRSNHIGVWIPGVGVEYQFTETFNSFLGIHKGFAPPGSKEGTLPEESVNYELGARYNRSGLHMQGVLFYNNYSNLLGVDLAASGGAGSGDLFNGGAARTGGLELEVFYNFLHQSKSGLRLPFSIAYTFTNSEFMSDFESDYEPWGTVLKGDELPYVPNHMLSLDLSLENDRFNVNINSRYNGAMRTKAGQDALNSANSIAGYFVLDLSANINLGPHIALTGSLLNVANSKYAVSDRPAGYRPGLPRSFKLGIKAHL